MNSVEPKVTLVEPSGPVKFYEIPLWDGNYVAIDNGVVVCIPVFVDGVVGRNDDGTIQVIEVTNLDNRQDLLDALNDFFRSSYTMNHFAGR